MASPSCLPRSFSCLLLLFISSISVAAGGIVGVNYGRDADNLIPPDRVVDLLKANGIGAAAIYDGDEVVLNAFKNSGIKLVVALRNELLASCAMNSYYQRHGRGAGTCDFSGVGRIVNQRPRYGNCELPSSG